MRFLVDECTGPAVAYWLRGRGHEVFSVYEQTRGLDDQGILEMASKEKWIIVTNDKDFGEKIYREKYSHHGLVLLRLKNERAESKIAVLEALLERYSEKIADNFLVVTETQVRVGILPK